MPFHRSSIEAITEALLAHVEDDAQADLRCEDPRAAVEVYFGPIGFQALPGAGAMSGECATDGFYDSTFDPSRPWIIYDADVAPGRVRFTILHELGHHLLATVAATLLDPIDSVAGTGSATDAEEAVCHRFAGRLLVPGADLAAVVGSGPVRPDHVVALHERCLASWEATAIRVAESMAGPGAVVLVREPGIVSFCAASPSLGTAWWPRGSGVDPDGPLTRALGQRSRAQRDTYRYGLGYPRAMFCDTLPVHDHLAVGVLGERPSDGGLSVIEQPEPAWRVRVEFCEWHPGIEREVGWCDRCKGRRCPECGRCGCQHPVVNPLCPSCGLRSPFRAGAEVCRDCEADGGGHVVRGR